jgi:hypothetical protein
MAKVIPYPPSGNNSLTSWRRRPVGGRDRFASGSESNTIDLFTGRQGKDGPA